jgi:hypothetical protein
MNRTARLDFDPLYRRAPVTMVSTVPVTPVETRHEDQPKRRGRPKATQPVRVEPVHNLREPG